MESPLIWSLLFCFLMVAAVTMEMMTPSFGLFTAGALALLGASIWFAFLSSPSAGYAMIGLNVTLFPLAIFFSMKMIKRSPLTHHQEIHAGVPHEPASAKPVHELVGQEGRALTALRPAGTVQIGERRLDVVTEGKFVEVGTAVRVLRADGNVVVVEPLS